MTWFYIIIYQNWIPENQYKHFCEYLLTQYVNIKIIKDVVPIHALYNTKNLNLFLIFVLMSFYWSPNFRNYGNKIFSVSYTIGRGTRDSLCEVNIDSSPRTSSPSQEPLKPDGVWSQAHISDSGHPPHQGPSI